MKKNTIYKKLEIYEEKLIKAINDLRDFLDSVEDAELSSMADEFSETLIDFLHENDTVSLDDIRKFIENDYDPE
jgi:hypothetical protein